MFKYFKDKLKGWTEKVTKESEESEETAEAPKEIKEEIKEEKEKPKEPEKKKKKKPERKSEAEEIIGEAEDISDVKTDEKQEVSEDEDLNVSPKGQATEEVGGLEPQQETAEEPGTESFFRKVTGRFSKIKITEEKFEVYSEELEMLLLENNVAFEVTEEIIKNLREKIVGKELLKKEVEEEIKDSLKEIIEEILIEPFDVAEKVKERKESGSPYVIMFCGVNGTGKTTSIAKVAEYLKNKNLSCVLAAGDTFRAASIEQLKTHGERLGVKVISHEYGSDPASVGHDAISYAKKNSIDCVLIDTAGRMHTDKNLLREISKISRVCNPDLKIFVGESITGNDAIEQAKSFNFEIGIDGIILTKADIDEKGGTALSVGFVTKRPILYLGTGQEYDKIEPFSKQKFIERLGL